MLHECPVFEFFSQEFAVKLKDLKYEPSRSASSVDRVITSGNYDSCNAAVIQLTGHVVLLPTSSQQVLVVLQWE